MLNTLFGVVFGATRHRSAKSISFLFNDKVESGNMIYTRMQNKDFCACQAKFVVMQPGSFSELTFSEVMDLKDNEHPLFYMSALKDKPSSLQFFCFAMLCYHKVYAKLDALLSGSIDPSQMSVVVIEEYVSPLVRNALIPIQ